MRLKTLLPETRVCPNGFHRFQMHDAKRNLVHQSVVYTRNNSSDRDTVQSGRMSCSPECSLYLRWAGQNASAVYAIMKTLVAFIKQPLPEDSTWNYFESGHGEGLCDGIHDRPKRMSNDAVKERKYSTKNVFDFYVWAKEKQTNSTINYDLLFVLSLLNKKRFAPSLVQWQCLKE